MHFRQFFPQKRLIHLSTQRKRHQIWQNKIVADNVNQYINTEPMLVIELMHYMGDILLPFVEVL